MKNFINKILDVPKLIRRIWILLWLLLVILLVMKFCFGIWYPIVIENEYLLRLNDFVQNSFMKYFVMGIFYVISGNILYLISCRKSKYESIIEMIVISIMSISSYVLKMIIPILGTVVELCISVVIPTIYLIRTKKYYKLWFRILYPTVIQAIISVWQLNIFFIRNVDMSTINDEYFIIGFALQLDYYIFIIITWIGVSFMGLWSFWFFNHDVTALKAEKQKELGKKNPDMKKVESLDIQIAKLEKEGK